MFKNIEFNVNTDDDAVAYDIESRTVTVQALGHKIKATQDVFYLNDDLVQLQEADMSFQLFDDTKILPQ